MSDLQNIKFYKIHITIKGKLQELWCKSECDVYRRAYCLWVGREGNSRAVYQNSLGWKKVVLVARASGLDGPQPERTGTNSLLDGWEGWAIIVPARLTVREVYMSWMGGRLHPITSVKWVIRCSLHLSLDTRWSISSFCRPRPHQKSVQWGWCRYKF